MSDKTRRMYAAREAWIMRWTGYYGDPPKLEEYRNGEVSFLELYRNARSRAEDMATESSNISQEAFE